MNLYTGSGDDGTTGLFGGQRVGKDRARVEAYGSVDELNATIGLVGACIEADDERHEQFKSILRELQSRLFDIGADLATPEGDRHEDRITRISDEQVAEVERWIDQIDSGNDPMQHFVLPGGCELAARLHFARTVCRRSERMIVRLAHSEHISASVLKYFNRLGDLLFAMARRANKAANVPDVPWQGLSPGRSNAGT